MFKVCSYVFEVDDLTNITSSHFKLKIYYYYYFLSKHVYMLMPTLEMNEL